MFASLSKVIHFDPTILGKENDTQPSISQFLEGVVSQSCVHNHKGCAGLVEDWQVAAF